MCKFDFILFSFFHFLEYCSGKLGRLIFAGVNGSEGQGRKRHKCPAGCFIILIAAKHRVSRCRYCLFGPFPEESQEL